MLFSSFSGNFFQTFFTILQYCLHLIGEIKFWKQRYLMAQNELIKAQNSLSHYKDLYDGLLSLHSATLGRLSALQEKDKEITHQMILDGFNKLKPWQKNVINEHSEYYYDQIETLEEIIYCFAELADNFDDLSIEKTDLEDSIETLEEKISGLESKIEDLETDVQTLETQNDGSDNDCLDFDNLSLGLFYRDKHGNNHKLTITKCLTVCYQINDSYSKDCAGKQAKMNISSFKMMGSICQWYANLLGDDLYCSPNSNQKYKLYQRFGWVPYGATSLKLTPKV